MDQLPLPLSLLAHADTRRHTQTRTDTHIHTHTHARTHTLTHILYYTAVRLSVAITGFNPYLPLTYTCMSHRVPVGIPSSWEFPSSLLFSCSPGPETAAYFCSGLRRMDKKKLGPVSLLRLTRTNANHNLTPAPTQIVIHPPTNIPTNQPTNPFIQPHALNPDL